MAVFFKGMSFEETGYLTRAMIDSGEVIDLSGIDAPLVDKHSTGGVGDKVSLILAPLAAACGCTVPMMSGRALGHTGGTLDKLESIPGYRTDLSVKRFTELLKRTGFAMTGQSEQDRPGRPEALRAAGCHRHRGVDSADHGQHHEQEIRRGSRVPGLRCKMRLRRLYENPGAGPGAGGFPGAHGNSLGRRIRAVISDMDQPLGLTVGNFLEIREVVETLRGGGPKDLLDLTIRLTAHMLVLADLQPDVAGAEEQCRQKLADGSAWEKFLENVELQGGDVRAVDQRQGGPTAPLVEAGGGRGVRIRAADRRLSDRPRRGAARSQSGEEGRMRCCPTWGSF